MIVSSRENGRSFRETRKLRPPKRSESRPGTPRQTLGNTVPRRPSRRPAKPPDNPSSEAESRKEAEHDSDARPVRHVATLPQSHKSSDRRELNSILAFRRTESAKVVHFDAF